VRRVAGAALKAPLAVKRAATIDCDAESADDDVAGGVVVWRWRRCCGPLVGVPNCAVAKPPTPKVVSSAPLAV
jgi:hypothetical protein